MIDEPEMGPPSQSSSEPEVLTTRKRWLLPALICLASLLVFSYYARQHPYGTYTTETDFYQFYGPDAERIGSWQFPENPYQGPGYPAVLALVSKLTGGDLFGAGKWLSVISAAMVGFLSFILFSRLFGYWPGVGAQLSVLVVTQLPVFAINPTTDIFFLVPCLASLAVFTTDRLAAKWRVPLTALLVGITYLTRYNGVFLFVTCLFGIVLLNVFERSWRARFGLAAVFIAVFLVTVAPWLYANYKHNGSPFYNTNYLNIATEFYPDLANESVFQDSTRRLAETFHSFGDVFRHDPARMLKHYPENLSDCLGKTITLNLVSQWVGWLALAGFALALVERRSKSVTLVLISIAFCVLLLALTHWEDRYYFYVGVMYSGLAAYACARVLRIVRERGWARHRAFVALPLILFAVMWSVAFMKSRRELTRFLGTHPTEIIAACDYLKSENVSGARIVARKPHLPAICNGQWVYFPQVESLEGLKVWLQENQVDYIAFGIREQAARPQLSSLKNPATAPPWLKPVWVSEKPPFVLYKPE
ncbi:MAG TPA: glycosyltransferase family 39 protein [Blastocatellia bacterium]|nr:glycosyltransferase family 39 protein [Blastocatellia bacterium]